jgi:hypothetical protein
VSSDLFNQPTDLAILRAMAKAGRRWLDTADIRAAIEWLGSTEHTLTPSVWRRVTDMETRGLLEGRKAAGTGRDWRIRKGVSIRLYTGGIDVLLLDREEALTAATDKRRVFYEAKAFLAHKTPRERAAKALLQCPSPFALGDRMQLIKWNNPELV